jgi:hypothetical protein
MMRAVLLGFIATALATAGHAYAQPDPQGSSMSDEVRGHWERGLAAHAARQYQAASAAFEVCYRLDPRREFLFAWAQAARLAGDCRTASSLYRRYLHADVSARQAEAARGQLAVCEAALAARAEATPDRPGEAGAPVVERRVESAGPAPKPVMPVEVQPRAPWYLDVWGDVLAGAGVAAVTAGTLMYVSSARDASSNAPTYGAYAGRFADARRTRVVAIVALGAGTALVTAGVLHMILRDDARGTPGPRIGVGLDGTPVGLHYLTTF